MNEDDRLDPRIFDAFAPPAPPADLADRVLAEVGPRPRRRWVAIVDVAALAALAAVVIATRGSPRADGALSAAVRTTVAIGERGRAVAEAGAALSWRVVESGAARVEQGSGRVFYRVDPGGPFVVATPAGEVRVAGTCFSVDIGEVAMTSTKKMMAAGTVGAALAALVTVTVYEGKVILASPGAGERAVAPGETARLEPSSASAPAAAPVPAPAAALAAGRAQAGTEAGSRDERSVLRARVIQLEKQLAHTRGQLDEAAREAGMAQRVTPTKEDLAAWAKKCAIHIDSPDVFGSAPRVISNEEAERWGLTPDETPIVEQAHAEAHARALATLRRIYVAATGDTAGVEQLSSGAMFTEIMDKAAENTVADARRVLSQERAGLAAIPEDLARRPPVEQALRLISSLGGDFEGLLSAGLGATRARELRLNANGWPGLRMDSDGCPK
jgi:hypothetical protein